MQRSDTQRVRQNPKRRASFQAVSDSRKRKVPGLWKRGTKYYAQFRIALGNGKTAPRRIALDATNLDEAKAELEKKRTENRQGKLPRPGHKPKFEDAATDYVTSGEFAEKKLGTRENEQQAINRWNVHLGGIRVDKITIPIVHAFREKRLKRGASKRTVNLDVIVLRNVFRFLKKRGDIDHVIEIEGFEEAPAKRKQFLQRAEYKSFLDAITSAVTKNAELFSNYIRFLALTGAREQEALQVRWSDVNFAAQQVTIGRGGVAKNEDERAVDFSPELKDLLTAMEASRPPDSSWLFPSPQRGEKDIHARSLRESLNAVRKAAKLSWVGFHDFRHFYAATCVMAGIDHMTISEWLGHSDGGKLVGEVYGHVGDEHKKRSAQKLTFLPAGE